jgi:type I restriction enzyme S subunit
VTPNNDLVGENYIWYALKSLRVFFNTIATGAAQQNISKERVVDAKIVVAPKNIISNFELKAKDIWIEIGVLSKQNIILQKTRDLLIPQLVTGRRELK